MKRRIISLAFMLIFMTFFALDLNAQQRRDGFFTPYNAETRNGSLEEGLTFSGFLGGIGEGFGQQEGLDFESFNAKENTVPVGNGMLLMATTSALYLITKRRKEDK